MENGLAVRGHGRSEVFALGPRRARVAFEDHFIGRDSRRQRHRRRGRFDGEVPPVSGDVPVELVVVLKEAQLPVGPVGQRVGILARRQYILLPAHVDPDAVGEGFGVVRLGLAVARDGKDRKAHDVFVSGVVLVSRGEVPVDAPLDLVAGAHDLDGLRHAHARVGVHGDMTRKRQDRFGGGRSDARADEDEAQDDGRGDPENGRPGSVPGIRCPVGTGDDRFAFHQKPTLTGFRSTSGLSSSKKSLFSNPNCEAIRFEGNCSIAVLKSLTTAL